MISFNDAIEAIQTNAQQLPSQKVAVTEAVGGVLAVDVLSSIHMPPFDQSAMDGYAVGDSSRSVFDLVGEIQAGDDASSLVLEPNQAIRIFTGAMVPAGAKAVVKQEIVERNGNQIIVSEAISMNENVRPLGEQIKQGHVALAAGTPLSPGVIGFLLTLGITEVEVYRLPKVTIIATGNELTKPGQPLPPGKIYESNTYMLQAALSELGIEANIITVEDELSATIQAFKDAIANCDIMITTGGISVGDYDFVGQAMQEIGVESIFYKVKQKPGKPLFFGKNEKTLVFSLPGNPAAALSCFYLYVRMSIQLLRGFEDYTLEKRSLALESSYRKTTSLGHFLKGKAHGNQVQILNAQSSAMLSSYSVTNAIIHLEEGREEWNAGDLVDVYLLP